MKKREKKPRGLRHQIVCGLLLGTLVLSGSPFSALADESSAADKTGSAAGGGGRSL